MKPMHPLVTIICCIVTLPLSILAQSAGAQNEIGFIEKFALAEDRQKVLGELVPGSPDYFFFHALHYQNTRDTARLADTLSAWRARYQQASPLRESIENREALLTYDADPQATLKYLREKYHVELNHTRESRDQKPDLPTRLDPALIAREVFEAEALEASNNLAGISEEGLASLVRNSKALNLPHAQRRALLKQLSRPDIPGLLEVIVADLRAPQSGGFGEFPIHRNLTAAQMDDLANRVPGLDRNARFVYQRVRKLAPPAGVDLASSPAERGAWLDRLWAYAEGLSPVFNTLKAQILFRRLDHDRALGIYDRARLMEYLKLPRRNGYANPDWMRKMSEEGQFVDLRTNLAVPLLEHRPVPDDEPLVREYFLNLFSSLENPAADPDAPLAPWTPYVRDTWLRSLLAEAMILAGKGRPEQWAALLNPTDYQQLKERVDIEFPASNTPVFQPGDEIKFDVILKNTPKLMVKVYEINQLNYYQSTARELNTDLALDGLVANAEEIRTYDAGPFLRKRETFSFPELKGRRGAWVIEFIGGGRSSRALIRVGRWQAIQQTGPAGDLLLVLDENGAPVPEAEVWLDGRKFTRNEELGRIVIPHTAQPGMKPAVLASPDGSFASLVQIDHHAADFKLDVQYHVNREQLLVGKEATLAVRPALLAGDTHLTPELLLEPTLTLTTTTLDDIATTRVVHDLKLSAGSVLTHAFLVPERLATLRATLSGKVDIPGRPGETLTLEDSEEWNINGIDKTTATTDGHFLQHEGGTVYELLGKNAEPAADQPVSFTFKHRDFTEAKQVSLRTDEKGRVLLGALPEITEITAETATGRRTSLTPETYLRTWPSLVQAPAEEPLRLPVSSTFVPALGGISLLEQRAGEFSADLSSRAEVRDGFVVIQGLPPGDYSLRLRGVPHEITVRLSGGKPVAGWLLDQHRHLQLKGGNMLQITGVNTGDDLVTVKLAHAGPFTRVHISTARYHDARGLFHSLGGFPRFGAASVIPPRLPNLYASGREIGDEYRYILERRYAPLYPGNQLARPGLLLNPWETRETGVASLAQAAGEAATSTSGARGGALRKAKAELNGLARVPSQPALGSNLDFLAKPAPVIYNLLPDKDGVVRIDRALLGDRQEVQIFAEDLEQAVSQKVWLKETATALRDQRLAKPLDPTLPFTEKKAATVFTKGQTFAIDDVATGELQTYDTLPGIYALFSTLRPDPHLTHFAWLMKWPQLSEAGKRAKYSEHACHELNFFLSRKDPAFFKAVVQPYLAHKKDKTFMDHYLVEADLKMYLEPWRYARLNAVERALLGARIAGEAPRAARHLREAWALLPADEEKSERLFETALRGRAMDSGYLSEAKDRRRDLESDKPSSEMPPPPPAPAAAPAPAADAFSAGAAGRPGQDDNSTADIVDLQALRRHKAQVEIQRRKMDEPMAEREEVLAGKKVQVEGERQLSFSYLGLQAVAAANQDLRPYFRELGPTREWAENNYYQQRITAQDASLVTVSAFWVDFAAWIAGGSQGPFLSPHVAEASRNFTEMMLALAVLDLPFESLPHATRFEGKRFELTAGGQVLVYHRQIQPLPPAPGDAAAALLVSQRFFKADDRYREENGEKIEKPVTGEFLTGTVYGANVVVTNAGSSRAKAEVLLQIPQGALPLRNSRATRSVRAQLDPYTTRTFEYYFYFPAPPDAAGAKFAHYPVHVAEGGLLAGQASAFAFEVVNRLTTVDKASWDYVSQHGTEEEVFAHLGTHNLQSLPLHRLAWRCREDAAFYRKLTRFLRDAHVWDETLAGYALLHNDPEVLRDWLKEKHEDQFGPYLKSTLVVLDPTEHRTYEHLEYSPLVNQRAHRLGNEWRIANPAVLGQYQSLLAVLAHKPALEPADHLAAVYYLLLQDRVEEGLARLRGLDPATVPSRLQLDYLRCYAAFYEGDLATARSVATPHAGHPVARWQKLFSSVLSQADEIEGKAPAPAPGPDGQPSPPPDREMHHETLASTEPSFDFKVENRTVALTWQNLDQVTVNYYLMDPEFSFSSNPFVGEEAGRFSIIKPSLSAVVTLPAGRDAMDTPLPAQFAKANVLVEVVGAGQRKTQAYHANTFKLTVAETYGRLEVRDQGTNGAVPKAYVKVYARLKDGTVRFYKDGYTDLRGRFDYASLNRSSGPGIPPQPQPRAPMPKSTAPNSLDHQMLGPSELDQVVKLAILVLHEANGALVHEVGAVER